MDPGSPAADYIQNLHTTEFVSIPEHPSSGGFTRKILGYAYSDEQKSVKLKSDINKLTVQHRTPWLCSNIFSNGTRTDTEL